MTRLTIKLIQQDNGLYKIKAFDNGVLVREEKDLYYKTAIEKIEQMQEEERNAAKP